MHKEVFKRYLIRDKAFLRELYEGPSRISNNRILIYASDNKLNTLIRFLHFLSNGEIKMKRDNFEIIQANRKLGFLKKMWKKRQLCQGCLKVNVKINSNF